MAFGKLFLPDGGNLKNPPKFYTLEIYSYGTEFLQSRHHKKTKETTAIDLPLIEQRKILFRKTFFPFPHSGG